MIDENETRMMETPGSVRQGEDALMNGKWGGPAVGIHSVGDTHFGDTHFGDTHFGTDSVPDENVSAPPMRFLVRSDSQPCDAASGALEPFEVSVRKLNLHRDPDATPIHPPAPELLHALNSELVPSRTAGVVPGVKMIEQSAAVPETTHSQHGLYRRFRGLPTPVLGMIWGGMLGLVSASLIQLQKRETKASESAASPGVETSPASHVLKREVATHEDVSSRQAGVVEPPVFAQVDLLNVKAGQKPSPARPSEAVLSDELVLDELATNALTHHFAGRCSAASSAYARLELSAIAPEDQKMWRAFARASASTCLSLSEKDSL